MLCNSGFEEALVYLGKDASDKFDDHVRTFLEVFLRHSYKEDSIAKLMGLVAKTCNVEIVQLFFSIMLVQKNSGYSWYTRSENQERAVVGLEYPGTEEVFSELLKSVSWENIKVSVEKIIKKCKLSQMPSWLKCADLCSQSDITQYVADVMVTKIQEGKWSPKTKECIEVGRLVMLQLFKDDAMLNTWLLKLTSLDTMKSNIEFLSVLISTLPYNHLTRYMMLFDSLIISTKNESLRKCQIDPLHIFNAVKSVIDVPTFLQKLKDLCNVLSSTGYTMVISALLVHLYQFKKLLLLSEGFQVFLEASMEWIRTTKLNDSHCQIVVDIVKVVMVEDADDMVCQEFVDICLKCQDIHLLCKVIEEIGLSKSDSSAMMNASSMLIDALIKVVEQNTFIASTSCIHTVPVIIMMFKDDAYTDLLKVLLAKKVINGNIYLVGDVLSRLCKRENSENFTKLKSSINFRSVLLNYISVLQHAHVMSDYENYVTIMAFLFANEDWCNELSPELLPALIGARCITNTFMCYAKTVSVMPSYGTTNFKILLTASVNALDSYMNRPIIASADLETIVSFVKILMANEESFNEIFMLFLDLPHLKTNEEQQMYTDSPSVLVKLISDTKETHQHSTMYQHLLLRRFSFLKECISKGKPQIVWEQPNAELPQHPQVQQFLRSSKQTFVYQNFNGIRDARNWASKHFDGYYGSFDQQKKKGYCCSAVPSGAGKKASVTLSKKPQEFLKEKLQKFEKLSLELRKLSASLKRPLADDDSAIPVKKPKQQENIIIIDEPS